MANNNYPQITSVTSESLQAQIRNLLPSQEGFGTDLMAQNVIVPIIDLTSAAEGSTVPEMLQTALSFGSQTAFRAENSTVTLNNTGFWRVYGQVTGYGAGTADFNLNNGITDKLIWQLTSVSITNQTMSQASFEFVVFLPALHSLKISTSAAGVIMAGSYRQIADVNGVLVAPSGFNPQ